MLLVVWAVALLLMFLGKKKPKENLEVVKAEYDLKENEVMLILGTDVSILSAVKQGDTVYLPLSIIKEKLNSDFYMDEDADDESITYVLPGEIRRFWPNMKFCLVNDDTVYTNDPFYIIEDGVAYFDMNFVAAVSDVRCNYYEDPDRVVLEYEWKDYLYYEVADETPVHVSPDIESGITMKLKAKTNVFYIGGYGNNDGDFVKIMTDNGLFGFIQKKHVARSVYKYIGSSYVAPEEEHILYDEKIKLGFWYVAAASGNETYSTCTKNITEMNVICPSWISLKDDEGNIRSFADTRFVRRAHNDGYKVWIMVDFPDGEVSPHSNLSKNENRDRLIKNIIDETVRVGADGVNIDFEALSYQTGVHFIEFIKELSVRCHMAGLVLSVDNLVPGPSTAHYDIGSQARFADYIIVMAYDEHYAASKEAGSVASIGFVRKAVTATAEVCDRNRIILGIPFYTRLWMEEGTGLTSKVYGYTDMEKYISFNKLKKVWDEDLCQNYIEFTKGNVVYKMWCEDKESIAYKCADAAAGDLAGIAAWRLGFEKPEVWDIIEQYIK